MNLFLKSSLWKMVFLNTFCKLSMCIFCKFGSCSCSHLFSQIFVANFVCVHILHTGWPDKLFCKFYKLVFSLVEGSVECFIKPPFFGNWCLWFLGQYKLKLEKAFCRNATPWPWTGPPLPYIARTPEVPSRLCYQKDQTKLHSFPQLCNHIFLQMSRK